MPKCKECGQVMEEIGGINKPFEIGEYRKKGNSEYSIWHQTGTRDSILYQCSVDKTILIE